MTKTNATDDPAVDAPSQNALLLAEEQVTVGKREVVTDRVRVRTLTRTVEDMVAEDLAAETIEITRLPIGREIDAVPPVREEGDLTVLPIVEEILVVETRLVLKEEVHIRRTRSVERVQTPVILRKQEAVVERLDADGAIKKEPTP